MDWSKPWDAIDPLMKRMAVGECAAHLRALARRGTLHEIDGDTMRWTLAG
jgi:hypothetical protein